MPFAHNLKPGIDLPVWQWMRFLPATSGAGACMCTDRRGTGRYIYMLFSSSSFWRYDTWTDNYQQLSSPGALGGSGTWGAGTCMVFDPSQGAAGRIWLLNGYSTQCGFGYYDIATNAWTSRSVTGLPAVFGTDGSLAHTCTTYHASGNDDYIYLIGNNSATWYRYSISGNSWSTMATALPGTAGAGCALHWIYGTDPNALMVIRGGATANIYKYNISVPGFVTPAYMPNTETFTTGTSSAYDAATGCVWIQKDSTHRISKYDLASDSMGIGPYVPHVSGTAMAGDGLTTAKTPDGAVFLYYRRQTGTEFWRALVHY